MAIYNTASDSANTAVRAFLTKVGEYYLGRSFNTGSGQGKTDWNRIREEIFSNSCAYCGVSNVLLQMEHLVMFNRTEYGLHHPGNIVPICKSCNKRKRNSDNTYMAWEEHLRTVCKENGEMTKYDERHQIILQHMKDEGYPNLSGEEEHAIRVIANSLYENIKLESEKSLKMYKELDKAFVRQGNS